MMLPFSIEHLLAMKEQLALTIKAKKDLEKSSTSRLKMGYSASRAKITSANARLSTNAEHYDKQAEKLTDLIHIGTKYEKENLDIIFPPY